MTFDRTKLFSTNATQERTITACGETFPVYVRRLPAVDLRKFRAETLSPDIEVRARAGFEALAQSIRNADGTVFATVAEYQRMDAEAIKALMAVFTEVNTQARDGELGNG